MESQLANSRDFNPRRVKLEIDAYEDYRNSRDFNPRLVKLEIDAHEDYNIDIIYNEIQNFVFLQEITSNYHNKSNTSKIQSILENQNIHNQNTENHFEIQSLSTFLLPSEQALQAPSLVSKGHEDTILLCIEDHSHIAKNMNLDQLYHINLDSILSEIINNDLEDATESIEDLNLIDNTNLVISPQETTQDTTSRPHSQQNLKRTVHTRNALYITNSLNKSLFNEGPATKKKRTPLFNSPTSTYHQSLANTRAPSPVKTHEQLGEETSISSLLDTYTPSSLPIPHEFQFNHINESTMQINSFSFASIAIQNEGVLGINDVPLSFENLDKYIGNEDIDITDLSLDTPILDDYSIGENINIRDAILQFDIPDEFPSDQYTNFVDISNHEITNDMSLNFETPVEFPSIENFDLLDISNVIDSNARNLNNPCNNTFHTIAPLWFVEQTTQLANNENVIHINDENHMEKDPNEMDLKAIDDVSTNLKARSQEPNDASTLYNAKDVNVKSVYVLDKDKTSLVSTDLTSHDSQELLEKMSEQTNELQEESFVEMMRDANDEYNEGTDELYYFGEMMNNATEKPIEELNEIQGEPLVGSMPSNLTERTPIKRQIRKRNAPDQIKGIFKVRGGWRTTLPNFVRNDESLKIGVYATLEAAARVQDLLALKFEMHLKTKNFCFNFPLAAYKDDFEEMQKWSQDDYVWSMKRQVTRYAHSESGLKCVHRSQRKNPQGGDMWVGKVLNQVGAKQIGDKTVEGYQRVIIVEHSPRKEIVGIFTDLVNLHLSGWEYVTNFRRGHYTVDHVEKFVQLLQEKKVCEAYGWDLIEQVLSEPLPTNVHMQSSQKIIEPNIVMDDNASVTMNNESLQGVNPKEMAKHFTKCPWIQLDESWSLYRKPSEDCDLEFEDTIIHMFRATNWSPSNEKLYSEEHKEYKFYFPCVIATDLAEVNIQRRILGLDYHQYLINTPDTCTIEYYQKQWVNLPNIRYLELDFFNVIACDGGLIVVKREPNEQNWSDQDKNKSTIIITNPLTYDIKFLPPIPYKILQQKIARLVFYDSSRTTYRLIVIGVSHREETIHEDDIQIIGSTQISLVVYCSIKESWVHFEHILNATPSFVRQGYSNIVVHGCSIYYGGLQISVKKKRRPKPVIFYFNINNSKRQQLIIDFTKAGDIYFIKVVEPPKLVQIGFNTKIYAVSRQAQYKKKPDILFINEVVVNEDGTPTGSYKVLAQGIMPEDLYKLLFKKRGAMSKMYYDDKLPPWEVMASVQHIAIKVIGFDPLIVLYNVKDQKWNYSYFPYIEPIQKLSNTKAWRLIPGVYEPRWNAIP